MGTFRRSARPLLGRRDPLGRLGLLARAMRVLLPPIPDEAATRSARRDAGRPTPLARTEDGSPTIGLLSAALVGAEADDQ